MQQYEEWKKNLPDTDWIKGLIPVIEADKFRTGISKAADGIKGKANEIDFDELLSEMKEATLRKTSKTGKLLSI